MVRKKVLIVDDSSTALLLEQMILRKEPYELLTARDGREAIEVALRERPDLILMDFVMPNVDGAEACRRLRENDVTRAVPIILVTTRGEAQNVERGYASGCTDYVTKPVDAVELVAKVRCYLGGEP